MRTLCLLLLLPFAVFAESFDDVIAAELRPGWRMPDGTHMSALHISLAPGWKTYWRAPGDAGIPPEFRWHGAHNISGIEVIWPAPQVFYQSGMRSVGYDNEVVMPLKITPTRGRDDARLSGTIDIGICKDICIPHQIQVEVALPASGTRPDPMIVSAMADTPLSGAEAGIGAIRCSVAPAKGGVILQAEIPTTGRWDMVIEAANPEIWVSEPRIKRDGKMLHATSMLRHSSGGAFALNRGQLRFTLLGPGGAVDIQGCKG